MSIKKQLWEKHINEDVSFSEAAINAMDEYAQLVFDKARQHDNEKCSDDKIIYKYPTYSDINNTDKE
jgi:hypothetical protein